MPLLPGNVLNWREAAGRQLSEGAHVSDPTVRDRLRCQPAQMVPWARCEGAAALASRRTRLVSATLFHQVRRANLRHQVAGTPSDRRVPGRGPGRCNSVVAAGRRPARPGGGIARPHYATG